MLERHQHDVWRHWRPPERVHTHRAGNRIQHRAVGSTDRRLADTTRADGRLGIGKTDRVRMHRHGDVENGERLVVVKPLGQRHAVVRVVDPLLAQRVADAEAAPAVDLRHHAPRVDDCPDVSHAEKVDERRLPGLEIDFDFGETGDERVGGAVARVRVLGHAHQSQPSERSGRGFRGWMDILRKFVPVVRVQQRRPV